MKTFPERIGLQKQFVFCLLKDQEVIIFWNLLKSKLYYDLGLALGKRFMSLLGGQSEEFETAIESVPPHLSNAFKRGTKGIE